MDIGENDKQKDQYQDDQQQDNMVAVLFKEVHASILFQTTMPAGRFPIFSPVKNLTIGFVVVETRCIASLPQHLASLFLKSPQ
jgi:hypothetical protein